MKYENFRQAYFDNYPAALKIGDAIESALTSLHKQNIVELTSKRWWDHCQTAWAFHVAEQQED